jgi:uncharacterized membrane protein YheB (UPF0754 family)
MLFRPYREWRVFRIRVPFTPGIIPRQRYKLAENIGQMVSDELLTEDTLIQQVSSDTFRAGLKGAVSRLTGRLFDATIGELRLRKPTGAGLNLLPFVEDLIRGFLQSRGIKRIIDVVIHAGLRSLTHRKIGDLFGGEEQKERFLTWIVNLLRAPNTGESIVEKAAEWIDEKSARETKVSEYLPPEATDWVVGLADVLYEPVFGFVLEWLESASMKTQLEGRGRGLLKGILEKLSIFQRLLVAATQYDRTLDEKMPEIVDDVLASMKETVLDESTRTKMLATVSESIERLRGQTIGEINSSYDVTSRLAKALKSVQNTIARNPAGDSLKAGLRGILSQLENRSIESFLEHALSVKDAADYLSELVLENVQESADRISKAAIGHLSEIVDLDGHTRVGDLLGFTSEAKQKLDTTLSTMAETALAESVPVILDTLDLNGMVVSKINGLAVEDVEGLLMLVIHRHLKWINVFGAVLGFLIGLIQIFTRFL